jgi:Ni,Fe-hydrogenase III large subunit
VDFNSHFSHSVGWEVVDPSFLTWPALADTIVPDFPLVDKSFNLSYAGNDL